MKIGCVVMAAGSANRFGSNKLLVSVGGRSLIRRALESVPVSELEKVVVVAGCREVAEVAESFGFLVVENRSPELGQSRSIRLGLLALPECDGALFMVADQPMLRQETVAAQLSFFRENPEHIVALGHGGRRGNPCVFPAGYFPELLALEGDIGGSAVIKRHPEALLIFEAAERELEDVDTPRALEALDKK